MTIQIIRLDALTFDEPTTWRHVLSHRELYATAVTKIKNSLYRPFTIGALAATLARWFSFRAATTISAADAVFDPCKTMTGRSEKLPSALA